MFRKILICKILNKKIKILVPIYNDWQSLTELLSNINTNISNLDHEISVVVINDASNHDREKEQKNFGNIHSIKILNMTPELA